MREVESGRRHSKFKEKIEGHKLNAARGEMPCKHRAVEVREELVPLVKTHRFQKWRCVHELQILLDLGRDVHRSVEGSAAALRCQIRLSELCAASCGDAAQVCSMPSHGQESICFRLDCVAFRRQSVRQLLVEAGPRFFVDLCHLSVLSGRSALFQIFVKNQKGRQSSG